MVRGVAPQVPVHLGPREVAPEVARPIVVMVVPTVAQGVEGPARARVVAITTTPVRVAGARRG